MDSSVIYNALLAEFDKDPVLKVTHVSKVVAAYGLPGEEESSEDIMKRNIRNPTSSDMGTPNVDVIVDTKIDFEEGVGVRNGKAVKGWAFVLSGVVQSAWEPTKDGFVVKTAVLKNMESAPLAAKEIRRILTSRILASIPSKEWSEKEMAPPVVSDGEKAKPNVKLNDLLNIFKKKK